LSHLIIFSKKITVSSSVSSSSDVANSSNDRTVKKEDPFSVFIRAFTSKIKPEWSLLKVRSYELPNGKIRIEGGKFIVEGSDNKFQAVQIEVFQIL